MKIATVSAVFPPYAGGQAHVARDCARLAAAAGHEVVVVTPSDSLSHELVREEWGIVHKVAPLVSWGKASLIRSLHHVIDASFDLIHIHYPCVEMIYACSRIHARYPSLPILVTYHMDLHALGFKGLLFNLYSRYALRTVANISTHIHVTSKEYFESSPLYGIIDESKVTEIPLSVDTDRFLPLHGDLPTTPTVLFVGALDRAHLFKGIEILFLAWRLVIQETPTARLVVVGTGQLQKQYQTRVRQLEIAHAVYFAGYVPDDELPMYYNTSHITVLPSVSRSEAFGLVLAESQSCGTPVVATDISGVRSVVDPTSGICVPPRNPLSLCKALTTLLREDKEHLRERRASARAFARTHFDHRFFSDNMLALYTRLVSRVASPRHRMLR